MSPVVGFKPARPKGMPSYPAVRPPKGPPQLPELLSDMMWLETALTRGNFSAYVPLARARKKLGELRLLRLGGPMI